MNVSSAITQPDQRFRKLPAVGNYVLDLGRSEKLALAEPIKGIPLAMLLLLFGLHALRHDLGPLHEVCLKNWRLICFLIYSFTLTLRIYIYTYIYLTLFLYLYIYIYIYTYI